MQQSETEQEDEDVVPAAPGYRSLITIHAGKPKGHLKDELRKIGDKVRRLSVSEQALEKAATSYGTDIVRWLLNSVFPFESSLLCYKMQIVWLSYPILTYSIVNKWFIQVNFYLQVYTKKFNPSISQGNSC